MSGTHVIPEPQLERLQEQLNELFSHSTVDPRVDGLIVRMNVVEVEIQNHAAQIATLTTNLTSVSNTVSQLTDAVNGNSNAILALRNSLTSLSNSLDAIIVRVTGIESDITTINSTLTNHESRLNTQQTSISQLTQQMNNLDSDVVQLSARLTLLGNTVDGHTQSISNLQSSISTLSSRLSTDETNIGNLSSRVGQNTSSISQLTNRLENLNADDIGFEAGSSGMQSADVENAIIEAYNHGGSSGPVSADDVSFDPSDTDLSSTNVEDVVKEVNDKTVDLETSVSQLTQTVNDGLRVSTGNQSLVTDTNSTYYNPPYTGFVIKQGNLVSLWFAWYPKSTSLPATIKLGQLPNSLKPVVQSYGTAYWGQSGYNCEVSITTTGEIRQGVPGPSINGFLLFTCVYIAANYDPIT